jgi:1,2-diacylglycerol 3-alpha-glucosyltransferase/glucuronosyltransferase
MMRILIATDAWHPQVNGVVRTLTMVAEAARALGVEITFLAPDSFRTVPMPGYAGLRIAVTTPWQVARLIDEASPDAIHIATEGPIGLLARRYCRKRGRAFTTSFHTRFPDYVTARIPVPESFVWWLLRRFHAPSGAVMAATPALMRELRGRGFRNVVLWSRGVDSNLFRPREPTLDLLRPIFLSVGRIAREKNLEAFLDLDLPGTKVVVGDGPAFAALKRRYPEAKFPGELFGERLAEAYASADVFVFPSKTDTFGLVLLEALASGVPVAAFPVAGPRDVITDPAVGVLDDDLHGACLRALKLSRDECRAFAVGHGWESCARMFIGHVSATRLSAGAVAPIAQNDLHHVTGDACEVAAISSTLRVDGYQDHDRAGDAGRH